MFPFSSEDAAPLSMGAVLMMPLLFTFFGVAARVGVINYRRTFGKRPKYEWAAYVPLAIAILYGIHWLYQLFDLNSTSRFVYLNSGTITGKVRIAHYMALIIPVLTTLGLFLYDRKAASAGSVRAAK